MATLETVNIEGTEDTPSVFLEQSSGVIRFSGRSLPEDVQEFYVPLLDWISAYLEDPQTKTHAIFKFDYFNTASSKKILDLVESLKELEENGKEIIVDWHYLEDDDDMKEAGEQFSEFSEIPFNFVEEKDEE